MSIYLEKTLEKTDSALGSSFLRTGLASLESVEKDSPIHTRG